MNIEQLREKIRVWDSQIEDGTTIADSKYGNLLAQIDYFAQTEWKVYLPAEHPDFNPSYLDRLASWIGNVSDEQDQKLLLEYALYISFFSHADFNALYRTAFDREITRWVAQQADIRFDSAGVGFQQHLQEELHQKTWFCPVTDSMDINEFYHVNHLQGVGHRPCFFTLQYLSEEAGEPNLQLSNNVLQYMQCPTGNPQYPGLPLERIVLMEDFVGSGTQCLKAIRWAINNLKKNVLFIPLILCPNGAYALTEEKKKSLGKLTVRPIVELQRSDLLGGERQNASAWPITEQVEELLRKNKSRVDDMNPFGYKGTGCSIANFSNTPDNTPPLVHHESSMGTWEPLFPRVFRD
jgi:hypothetical protein